MEPLKITLTLTKNGVDTQVGFLFDKDFTENDFRKNAQVLIECAVRKLEIEEAFV